MEFDYIKTDKLLVVKIIEEIDHHTTEKIRRKIDNEITRYMPRKVILDFNKVSFMDSAGIGMIIGRYKMIKMLGGYKKGEHFMKYKRVLLKLSGEALAGDDHFGIKEGEVYA